MEALAVTGYCLLNSIQQDLIFLQFNGARYLNGVSDDTVYDALSIEPASKHCWCLYTILQLMIVLSKHH